MAKLGSDSDGEEIELGLTEDWGTRVSDLSSSSMEEEEEQENTVFWHNCKGRDRDVEEYFGEIQPSCRWHVLESNTAL